MPSSIMTISMQSKSWVKYLELILVTGVLAFVYLSNLNKVEFHQDESEWIGTSGVFESYLRLEFKSPVWNVSYATLTQPPITRYVIGLSRYIGGSPIPHLHRPRDFEHAREFN